MAKKFVKVTGINKALSYDSTSKSWSIISSASTVADENSILYITANDDDSASFGTQYQTGSHWVFAKGQLFGANPAVDSFINSATAASGALAAGDSVQTAILKLLKQVQDASNAGVTALTTSGTTPILMTTNTAATGAVTINASHALSGVTSGTYGTKTSNLNFNVPSVTVDTYGHITSASTNNISLGDAATHATSYFATAGHTHDVSMIGDVTASKVSLGTSEVALSTTIKDGVVTKSKLASSIFGSVATDDASLVTGGQVYTAIADKVAASVQYLGTVTSSSAVTSLSKAGYGDFVRATAAFQLNSNQVHVGDMLILDSSAAEAYKTAANWSIVHGENDTWRAINVDGTQKLAANVATALNFVSGNIKFTYETSGLTADASYVSLMDASAGTHGIADAADVATTIINNELVTSTAINDITNSVGLDSSLSVDWNGIFASSKTVVEAVKDLSTSIASVPTVSYTPTVTSSSTDANKLGDIKVGSSTYAVYGQYFHYNHPAKPTSGSAAGTSAGSASATTVLTGVTIDASGHVASVTTSNISNAYNQRAVSVNGTSVIGTSATTALDLSAGTNVSITYTNSKVAISAVDTKVTDAATKSTMYLLGHATTGTNATALTDASVYVNNGALYAYSFMENGNSIHASSTDDWATI